MLWIPKFQDQYRIQLQFEAFTKRNRESIPTLRDTLQTERCFK